MVWFFERAQEVTRLETRFDNDAREYVLIIEAPGVVPRTERFATRQDFQARLLVLERQLKSQNWAQRGDVQILADGWRGLGRARD
jgi:hypothetical protein